LWGAAILAPRIAQCAAIAWSAGPLYNGASGFTAIQTNGTLVAALNLGNPPLPLTVDPTGINITFQPGTIAGLFNATVFGSAGSTDANWNAIVNDGDWNFSGHRVVTDFLTGLTVGRSYQLQLFANDERFPARTQVYDDNVGNTSPTVTLGDFRSTLGVFTADASTQALGYSSIDFPIFAAYVLRDITDSQAAPEPALGFCSVIGATLLVLARRRSR
jgi:hypothetical protein